MRYKPDFLRIPYELYENKNIKSSDRDVFAMIYYFSKMKGEKCTACNKTIGDFVNLQSTSVSNSLTRLEKENYIYRTYKDREKKIRDEIIPLVDVIMGEVSLTNDRGITHKVKGVSLTNEQIKKSNKENNNIPIQSKPKVPPSLVDKEISPDDNLKEFEKYRDDSQRHIQLIGRYYIQKMKLKQLQPFPTLKALRKDFKRQLIPASELADYTDDRIYNAIKQANARTKEWTLLTCCKYINK